MIAIPKRNSKKKRSGYYKVYFRVRTKNLVKVWNFLDELINELGCPFETKVTGRPPKFEDLRVYVKICILIGYFDLTIDEIAGYLPLLADDSLDRSNVDRWFQRMDYSYIERAAAWLDKQLEFMFGHGEYIVDATKYTTTEYHEVPHKGKMTFKLVLIGLHILVTCFFKEGFISIKKFFVSDGWDHESPIFREKILPHVKTKPNTRLHGDKAFAAEENFEEIFEKELIPNISQKDNAKGGFWSKKAKKAYDDNLRKAIRGMVEVVFGGMETETGNKIRFKLRKTRKLYVAIRALTHQIRTYMRALEYKALSLLLRFATTSSNSISEQEFLIAK